MKRPQFTEAQATLVDSIVSKRLQRERRLHGEMLRAERDQHRRDTQALRQQLTAALSSLSALRQIIGKWT